MCRTVLLVVLAALGAPSAHAWQTTVSATPPDARPSAVAVDGAGDVIAVGRTVNVAGDEDAVVAKLHGADGIELWQRQVAGSGGADDLYRAVATTGTSILATGRVSKAMADGDALVARFAADGTPAWIHTLDGGASREDDAFAVLADAAGDVFVAGESTPVDSTTTRFAVWKRQGADGAALWLTELVGGSGTARAVVTDGSDVVAAGDVGAVVVVARLGGANGQQLWRTDVAGSANAADVGRVLAIGGGRVVVGGQLVSAAGDPDFAVVALDAASGGELWRVVIDGSAAGDADADDVLGVAVDAAGDVLVVGRLSDVVTDDDAVAMKLAGATGAELWRTVVKGGNDNADVFQALALDAAGDLLVAGTLRSPATRADLLVAKLANATGAEVWRRAIDGTEHAADTGMAVAADPSGDLVAAGRLRNGVEDGFFVTRRFGANGGDFPCSNGTTDPGEACDDGNVTSGDGCRADCTMEICGDGIVDSQEACDDGNTAPGDCCGETCTPEPDGTPCEDGDGCTRLEVCTAGVCTPGGRVRCTPASPCHLALCNPADGSCSSPPKAEGAPCNDANGCTVLDQCISGVCTGTLSVSCNDDEPCTTDGCAPALGCTFTPLEGFESISCTFQRPDIAAACGRIPRPVDRRIRSAKGLIAKAALAQQASRARRMLKAAMKNLEKAIRVADAQRKRGLLAAGCADVLAVELAETVTRVQGVRNRPETRLGSGSDARMDHPTSSPARGSGPP